MMLGKDSEWNSNLATLQRIGDLIDELHLLTKNPNHLKANVALYLNTMDCVFKEGQKFSDEEKAKCRGFQGLITTLKTKWGNALYLPKIPYCKSKSNPKYHSGWGEIIACAREYEIYLMECLDKHNMLLGEKDDPGMAAMKT